MSVYGLRNAQPMVLNPGNTCISQMSHPPHEIYDCNKISAKSKENWLIDFGLTKPHNKEESNDSNHDDILDKRGLLHGAGTEDRYQKKEKK